MSSLSDQGVGPGRPLGPAGAGTQPRLIDGSRLRTGAGAGRVVALVAPLVLVVQASTWMILGAGPFRTALAWSCTVVLALCLIVLFIARTAAPAEGAASVYWSAWQTGLRGSLGRWWRLVVGGVAIPAFVALLFGMGSSALEEPNSAQKIAAEGARIVAPSVEKARPLGKIGPGRHDDYRGRYEVHIPMGDVEVEVLSNEYLRAGDKLYVAYAPSDTTLKPIADENRSQIEQQLSGRSMEFRQWVFVLIGWGGVGGGPSPLSSG
jgi:hypothetical protein